MPSYKRNQSPANELTGQWLFAGMKVAYKVDNVPFYKHTEEFRLGQSVCMSRRDKKPGKQHAAMRALPKGVEVDIQLDPPYEGAVLAFQRALAPSAHLFSSLYDYQKCGHPSSLATVPAYCCTAEETDL